MWFLRVGVYPLPKPSENITILGDRNDEAAPCEICEIEISARSVACSWSQALQTCPYARESLMVVNRPLWLLIEITKALLQIIAWMSGSWIHLGFLFLSSCFRSFGGKTNDVARGRARRYWIPSLCLDHFRFNLSGSSGLDWKICTIPLSLGANSTTSSAKTHTGASPLHDKHRYRVLYELSGQTLRTWMTADSKKYLLVLSRVLRLQ